MAPFPKNGLNGTFSLAINDPRNPFTNSSSENGLFTKSADWSADRVMLTVIRRQSFLYLQM